MGGKGSGGLRPNAPQNNPANISATGGNGQSGKQPVRYISGLPYGQGQATMAQEQAAPMAATEQTFIPSAPLRNLPQVTPITEPTQRPNEPVTAGSPIGPGAGTEALSLPSNEDTDEDRRRLLSYIPVLEVAAQSPNSSQAFRNYVRVLRANLL